MVEQNLIMLNFDDDFWKTFTKSRINITKAMHRSLIDVKVPIIGVNFEAMTEPYSEQVSGLFVS